MMKPLTDALLNVAWSRQERQRLETGVMPATHGPTNCTKLALPPRKDPRQTEGIYLGYAGLGERRFIKQHAPR
jgi:hypothetical protein